MSSVSRNREGYIFKNLKLVVVSREIPLLHTNFKANNQLHNFFFIIIKSTKIDQAKGYDFFLGHNIVELNCNMKLSSTKNTIRKTFNFHLCKIIKSNFSHN